MDDKIRVFIHHSFLSDKTDNSELREYIKCHDILQHTIFDMNVDGTLKVTRPTLAQQNFGITDTAFEYFVEQKITDGFVYGSLGSFNEKLNIN